MDGNVEYRIGWITASLTLSIAVIADLVQVLLTVTVLLAAADFIVAIIGGGFIAAIFYSRGVRYMSGKKAISKVLVMFSMSAVEIIDIVDAVPALTAGTLYIIRASRAEDREKFKEKQQQMQAVEAARVEAATNRAYNQHFRHMADAARVQERELEDA